MDNEASRGEGAGSKYMKEDGDAARRSASRRLRRVNDAVPRWRTQCNPREDHPGPSVSCHVVLAIGIPQPPPSFSRLFRGTCLGPETVLSGMFHPRCSAEDNGDEPDRSPPPVPSVIHVSRPPCTDSMQHFVSSSCAAFRDSKCMPGGHRLCLFDPSSRSSPSTVMPKAVGAQDTNAEA